MRCAKKWKLLAMVGLVGLLLLALPTAAHAAQEGDFAYQEDYSGHTVTITRYMGDGGAVEIPATIAGRQVSSVGSGAFAEEFDVSSIVVPEGVQTLGSRAFFRCEGLTRITLPSTLTTIGSGAFEWCYRLPSLELPEGLTTVGDSAFLGCCGLTSLRLPDAVVSLGGHVFESCTGLTTMSLPEGIEDLGGYFFANCRSLRSIVLPDSLKTIGYSAFSGCTSLQTIDIPDGVESIAAYASSGCAELESVSLPAGVTVLKEAVFAGCTNLREVSLPAGLTAIDDVAFQGCATLSRIDIPDGVTTVGKGAFWACGALRSVTLPDGVTTIGRNAFADCTALMELSLPDGLAMLPESLLDGCTSLKELDLPQSISSIGVCAFRGCAALRELTMPAAVNVLSGSAFSGCLKLERVVFLGAQPSIASSAFDDSSAIAYYPISRQEDWASFAAAPKQAYCHVTVDRRNGTPVERTMTDVTGGRFLLPDPQRAGWVFAGWSKREDGSIPWDFSQEPVVSDEIVAFARWVPARTVTFNTQGGSAVASQTVGEGALLTKPADPSRTGHAFAGWYKEAAYTNAWDFALDTVTENRTLYAAWTPKQYTVTFYTGSASSVAPQKVAYGGLVTRPADPTEADFVFSRWCKDAEGKTTWNFQTDRVTGDVTLRAWWTPILQLDVIANNDAWGTVTGAGRYVRGTKVIVTATPVEGYAFVHWLHGFQTVSTNPAYTYQIKDSQMMEAVFEPRGRVSLFIGIFTYNSVPMQWSWVQGAKGYEVWRSTSLGGGFRRVADTTKASFADKNVALCTTYYYKVRTKFADGFGAWSEVRTAKPALDRVSYAEVYPDGYTSVEVNWMEVAGATGYRVYRATSQNGTYARVGDVKEPGLINKKLKPGKTYYYKVRAYRAVGASRVYGPESRVCSGQPVPAMPDHFVARRYSSSSIRLSWGKVPGATKYQVYRATSKDGKYTRVKTTGSHIYIDQGRKRGKTYYYKVRAYRVEGDRKIYGVWTLVDKATP